MNVMMWTLADSYVTISQEASGVIVIVATICSGIKEIARVNLMESMV